MKKTLAILLALLAAASITLASCEKKDQPNNDGWDDEDNEYVDTDDDDGNDTTNDNNDDTTNDQNPGNNDNDPPTNSSGWVEKNDTVYAGVDDLNLRKEASTNSTLLKQISAGTKLNRISSNGTWSKVTLDGSTTEYHVLSKFLCDTNANFTFTDCAEPVTLTLNNEKGMVCFYTTPFKIWEGNTLEYNNIWQSSGVKAIDGEFKKIATSENGWMKVTVKGTITLDGNITKTLENEATFYIAYTDVSAGRVIDPDRPNAGNGSSGGNG